MGKLTVAKPVAQPTITVSRNNGGMQGSTYNPQQTAPSTVLQNPATAQQLQPTYNPQKTAPSSVLQPAATAAQIAAAAEAARQQAAAAAARAKEILRIQVQSQVDSKVAGNRQQIKLAVGAPSWKGKLTVSKKSPNYKITLPEQSEYDKAYTKAYYEALADFDKKRGAGQKRAFWQNLGDKLTFGQDRRDVAARKYAADQAQKIMDKDFKGYEDKINAYLKKQAAAQTRVNNAAVNFKSQAEYDAFVQKEQAALDKEYKALTDEGASYDGRQAAYGKSSQRALTSFSAKTLHKVGTFASDKNPVWKYTLGGGNENIPSLVTAPSRVVNWIGNLNTKDREIYQYGGGFKKRTETGKNAWQSGYNQRNFNIRPVVDKPFDKSKAYKELSGKFLPGGQIDVGGFQRKFANAKTDAEKEKIAKAYWDDQNRKMRNQNSAQELAADPLFLLQALKATKVGKAFGFGDKLSEAGRSSKLTSWGFKAADKLAEAKTGFKTALAENKITGWLGKEHQTPGEVFADTRTAIRDSSRLEQDALLKRIQDLGAKLAKNPKYDLSIFDELKALSPKEREVLQRMSGDGKLAARDRLLLMGRGQAPVRAKFEDLAKRYTAFTESMKLADDVKTTRFGLGKKRVYSPRTVWADNLDDYNFRLFKKSGVQSGDDFLHGVIDRFFKSNLDDVMVEQGKNHVRFSKEFHRAGKEYADSFARAKQAIGEAETKYKRSTTGVTGWLRNKKNVRSDVSFGRSVFNTTKNIQAAPTKIWKKSVLNLRPAWTVNNVLYNTQAGVLAGGAGSLVEQAKMLNPRYWRKAMDEGRAFRGNLGREIGKGWGNRFYAGVEDWSRVAAGRAALKKGLTEEQAVGRVNKYLFDYKTRNWERPIKGVLPFWSFQKNLAKAAATMPFDRPVAAVAYNRLDRYQQTQYDQEFSKLVPQLTELGYSEDEIQAMKEENAKYFRGRLKVGSRWITTPFNAFSEKGLTNIGLNPYLAAGREVADSVDSFGRPVSGSESGWLRRLTSKFPQWEIGRQVKQTADVNSGRLKPSVKYIGKPGSEGYGLGKEKQGYDSSKKNYVKSLDPRQKLGDNVAAFFGVPKSFQFDEKGFIKGKMLQKLTSEYFALDTKNMSWDDAEIARQKVFDKYGVTADDFYNGVLSKYDTDNTTRIKDMKQRAKVANDLLFDEYGKQPVGTRGAWAVKKLKELNDAGYFNDNPFLYSFAKTPQNPKGFITPESVHRISVGQEKKAAYEYAIKSGDWSAYAKKYGIKSEKAKLVQEALRTGDWSAYRAKYGGKSSPYQFAGKYFKSAESMAKYKEGDFWRRYSDAPPEERKRLLAENPEYNTRADWTPEMWRAERKRNKAELKKRAAGFGDINEYIAKNKADTSVKALKFGQSIGRRQKKVAWKLS